MTQLANLSTRSRPVRDLRALLEPLVALGESGSPMHTSFAGTFDFEDNPYAIPRVVFTGPPASHDPIRL